MEFFDTLTLDAPRRTREGYLVASVKVARSGIQHYTGREVDPENKHGMRDRALVRVLRPEDEVFNADSLRSYAHRPVTINHPPVAVTADNWKEYSVGQTDAEVMRDGQFVRTSMVLMDAAAISAVEAGKREISQGYACDIDWTAGITNDGLEYDVSQRNIRANHTAMVDVARGGPELKIGDNAVTTKPVNIVLDGVSHTVQLEDAAAILVSQLQTKLTDAATALTTAQTQIGTLTASVSTKDGEIAGLTAKLADAAITPAKLDAAVAERAKVIDAAKKIFPALVSDGKTLADIRKEAVTHKIADAATMADAAIDGAFAALSATVAATDTMADGLRTMTPSPQGEKVVTDARAEMIANLKNPTATKAA